MVKDKKGYYMKKLLWFILIFVVSFSSLSAQYLYSTNADSSSLASKSYVPDISLVGKYNPKKPLWMPAAEAVGFNILLGGFNAYITHSEFAKIGFHTIKHNFERGWSTDADAFSTNMFAHPFHGAMYYNFARSSGYNYYTSLGIATLGSWQWEFFMENEPPAFNDWVMTSYGGSMLGEMFYRISNLILDESKTGWPRFWNELAAGFFNPGRLINRLLYGRTSRITTEKLYEKNPFFGEIAFGGNNVAEGTSFKDGNRNPMITLDFTYGTLFMKKQLKPFDFFRTYLAVNLGSVQPHLGQFRIYNSFYVKNKKLANKNVFQWGIFGHYDYLENNVYQVGGVTLGAGIGYRTAPKPNFQFIGSLHAGALLMGGANSDYAPNYNVGFLDSARTYNMGSGAHSKFESIFRFNFGSLAIGYSFWWIHTWDGAPGEEFIGMLSPKFRVRVYKNWFVGIEYLFYHRFGKYDNYPNRNYRNNEERLFIGYAF